MKPIRQTITFKATPHDVYEMLMDSARHAEFTGDRAVISRKAGGTFSVFSGYATGKNLELIPDRRIVQTWRASDWPDGHESQITFELREVKGGSRLTFTQTGVPDEFNAAIRQGWIDYYFAPMKRYFAAKGGKG